MKIVVPWQCWLQIPATKKGSFPKDTYLNLWSLDSQGPIWHRMGCVIQWASKVSSCQSNCCSSNSCSSCQNLHGDYLRVEIGLVCHAPSTSNLQDVPIQEQETRTDPSVHVPTDMDECCNSFINSAGWALQAFKSFKQLSWPAKGETLDGPSLVW